MARSLRQSNGKRTWLLWFAGLSALVVVLGVKSLGWNLFFVFWDASLITLVIGVLFVGALIKSWLDISFLDRQTKIASGQVQRLQAVNDIAVFLRQERASVFKTHIQSLHTMFENTPKFDQDALVEVLHARLLARNKVVELFASILITLGLIGTIIGLIASVAGLSAILGGTGTDADALVSGVSDTVGGLQTAFFTTLFGAVLGGVFLRILCSVVDSSILTYTAHIAELTEVNVLPAMHRTAALLEEAGFYRKLNR